MNGSLVYVSGPFTPKTQTPEEQAANIAKAVEAGRRVRALGYVPLVPHVAVVPGIPELSWPEAMQECLALLGCCHLMVVLPGWENSKGCRIEIAHAREREIPVLCIEDLKEAI